MLEKRIKTLLEKAFKPDLLLLENDSEMHRGHLGSPQTGTSHFSVFIVSDVFKNLKKIDRHKAVYSALGDIWKEGLHALRITALTREEHPNTPTLLPVKPV